MYSDKEAKTSLPPDPNDELRPEYNVSALRNRVRGKYAHHFTTVTQELPESTSSKACSSAVDTSDTLQADFEFWEQAGRDAWALIKQWERDKS